MSAAVQPRLPKKAVIGLTISAVLLIAAVVLELYAYRQKHAIITEQYLPGSQDPLLAAVPSDTPLPSAQDLTPPPVTALPPPLARPGMPPNHPGAGAFSPGATPGTAADPQGALVARGREAVERFKCNTCHSLDGSPLVSTSFRKLFGAQAKLVDGTTVKVDGAYIRESILDPNAKKVMGPTVPMPSFAGQASDAEIDAIIAFIQSLDQ